MKHCFWCNGESDRPTGGGAAGSDTGNLAGQGGKHQGVQRTPCVQMPAIHLKNVRGLPKCQPQSNALGLVVIFRTGFLLQYRRSEDSPLGKGSASKCG